MKDLAYLTIIVSAGIIADKSVHNALRGKHYKRIVKALQLIYEALQRHIIRHGISNGLNLSDDLHSSLQQLRNPGEYLTVELQEIVNQIKTSDEYNSNLYQIHTK